jgi:hypothetical protein
MNRITEVTQLHMGLADGCDAGGVKLETMSALITVTFYVNFRQFKYYTPTILQ